MSIRVPADLLYLRPGRSGRWGGGEAQLSDTELLANMARSLARIEALRTISSGIITRSVVIGTTPTLIILSPEPRACTIINPTPAVGLTTTATFFSSAISSAGNSQVSPVGVSNYDSMHFFASVTNASGLILNLITQVQSPVTDNWIDVQDLVPAGITTNGDIYVALANFGIVTQFAVRWTITGSCTLSLGYALKGGLGGSSQGSVNTVFLGNVGVSLNAGYPLLEGQYRDYNFLENAGMYGIAEQNVTISVVEYL